MDIKQIHFAYTSYPLMSTAIFLFSVGIAAILFKFGNRSVTGFAGFVRRLLPAYGVATLFLLINLWLAFSIQSVLENVSVMTSLSSVAGLRELGKDRIVIFTGTISAQNERVSKGDKEYVAYLSGDDSWRPQTLQVDTQGTVVSIDGGNYAALNWPRYRDPFGDDSVRYLNPEQPVVVVGKTVAYRNRPLGESHADHRYGINAKVLYGGSASDFVSATQRRSLWPLIMVGLNSSALGALGIGVMVSGWRRLMYAQK